VVGGSRLEWRIDAVVTAAVVVTELWQDRAGGARYIPLPVARTA
jgi:hypothetical protein